MQFARPPNGFHIFERPAVRAALEEHRQSCPWLEHAYKDAIARLKMSGHNEGKLSDRIPGLRSVVEVDPITGRRRLGISYRPLDDYLTVYNIRVLAVDRREGDPPPF